MIPENRVPPEFKKRLDECKVSEAMFSVFLGLDIPPEELDTRGFHHLLLYPDLGGIDFDDVYQNKDFYRHSTIMVSVPTMHDPSLAPKGKSIMTLQYFTVEEFADNWGTKGGKRTPKYKEIKEQIADQFIENTERFIPGFSKKIDVKLTATPYTYKRYTLNEGGTTGGWSKHPDEAFTKGLKDLTAFLTPIKNMYQVGHWAFGMGGIPAGFMTGKVVSDVIKVRERFGI